jgi:hypothetical protein
VRPSQTVRSRRPLNVGRRCWRRRRSSLRIGISPQAGRSWPPKPISGRRLGAGHDQSRHSSCRTPHLLLWCPEH